MARFLFVVPPFTGHINPTLAAGEELIKKGHPAAWVGPGSLLRDKLPREGLLFPVKEDAGKHQIEKLKRKADNVSGFMSLKFLYEEVLLPLAEGMYDDVCNAADTFKPDLIISDQQAWAGFIAAINKKIKYATFCTTSAGISEPMEGFNKITQWEEEQIIRLQRKYGIFADNKLDNSELLTVVFSTRELVGDVSSYPEHYKFVGPSIAPRSGDGNFPWTQFHSLPSPKLYISIGTVNRQRGAGFFKNVHTALKNENYGCVCSAPPEFFPDIPQSFIVRPDLPQLELLPYVDLVICHAGHNTVCESLAHGLPLIVAPIKDDQSTIAAQCVAAGVAERIRFKRFKPETLLQKIRMLLENDRYKKNAEKIMESFRNAGGAEKAAELLIETVKA